MIARSQIQTAGICLPAFCDLTDCITRELNLAYLVKMPVVDEQTFRVWDMKRCKVQVIVDFG